MRSLFKLGRMRCARVGSLFTGGTGFRGLSIASFCGLVCALLAGAAPAGAVTQFGSGGRQSGQFDNPSGAAVDQQSGDVYLGDKNNHRIDKFDGSGAFLLAWGWGVNGESPAEELQTCTTGCKPGIVGTGAGEFSGEGPYGVTVDNDPLSSSYGDVYVVDWENFRVEKFDAFGKFLLAFGAQGTGDGQFEWDDEGDFIAVGPGGAVYVGDKARVQIFEPSGVWKENVPLSGLSSKGKVSALAVNPAGDMFVKDEGVPGVREIEPSGVEKGTPLDKGSETVRTIALDGSGDLFVGDSSGGFHVLEYDSTGKGLASFASKTLKYATGMAFADTPGELYVVGTPAISGAGIEYKVWIFTPPPPGPLIEPGSESATPGLRGTATLEAIVNPEGNETTYRFEYVDETHYQASGYASATSTPIASTGPGTESYLFEDHQASASLTGLVPGTTYHYRIVATNAKGTATGTDQSFEAIPPMLVDGPWASEVGSTSVTLAARINPLGTSTEYRLEYGTSTSYGHTLSGNVGEGLGYVTISYHLQNLEPNTTYHYRLVTTNEVGTVEGADHTFNTQLAGAATMLPDNRAWELVSPPNKKGAVIEPFNVYSDVIQAADDGSGITYPTMGPHVGENPLSRSIVSTVLSRRGPGGWSSTDIDMPRRSVAEAESAQSLGRGGAGEYGLFSPDLSLAVAEPTGTATPPLSSEATERTLYLRNNRTESFLPLVTPVDVPSGTKFGGEESIIHSGDLFTRFVTATPDLSHVVFESPLALTPEAVSVLSPQCNDYCGLQNLYEWAGGQLQLVNMLPDEKPEHEGGGANLAGENGGLGLAARPISADGRWVAWTWGVPYGTSASSYKGLYVRDMVNRKTFQLGGVHALYQTMSSDGSRIFFLEDGDLYEFNTAAVTQTDLTADHGASEENAGVRESVSDVSDDGSYVYFVATGVLAKGGVSGEDNLYLLHASKGEWTTTYVATLSGEDEKSWYEKEFGFGPNLAGASSRVSPDGRHLTFMSDRSLTGYDNRDAVSGQPDEEVYLYDAVSGRLVCASCNPTGARPVGALDSSTKRLLADNQDFWGFKFNGGSHWLAGSIPGWDFRNNGAALYQPRYLSDSGRLFFNSPDALVPQDTNGFEDVYEYELPGFGSCTRTVSAFSERSGGCVNLISSGTSSSESVFYDASENGDDVFFLTASRLTPADYDNTFDVYDAHVCSASAPCVAAPVSPPPCTSGDSCKVAPSAQPEIFGPAPSATFSGAGNVVVSPSKPVATPRSLTRAQKLARALRACRKKKSMKKRAGCERQARKRYPAKQSAHAKATRKGGR
jgi:hypothetical protein